MKKSKKKKHQILHDRKRKLFVNAMIDAITMDDQIQCYKKIWPQCRSDKSARVGVYRMLQEVGIKQAIDQGRQEKDEALRIARRQEQIRLAIQDTADVHELDAKMSAIARGEYRRKRKIPAFNKLKKTFEVITIEEEPTETDMIAAADKLYKRFAAYAPKVLQHEGGDTFIEFMRQIAKNNNKNIPNNK